MIRIFSDSTCEFSLQRQKELDVEVVPLSVHFGQESFRDGIDLTNEAFYARLRTAQELPHTSQTNPEEFVERFKPYVEQGDERMSTPYEIFDCGYAPYFYEAIKMRYPEYCRDLPTVKTRTDNAERGGR